MELHERLRYEREKRGLKQSDIAEILNISRPAYNMYENGKNKPTLHAMIILADFYQTSIDYLVGRYEKQEKNNDNR